MRTLGLLAWLFFASIAEAQDAGVDAGPPALTPPSLRDFAEADYPDEAEAAGLEATVELDITIAADGTVTDVAVAQGAGNGFDEAAIEAARRFVFEPARRGDRAVPSRIRYRYVFELADAPVETPEAPPDEVVAPAPAIGRLSGHVLDEDGEPMLGAEVLVTRDDGTTERMVTGEDGAFVFEELTEGEYAVRVIAGRYLDFSQRERVEADTETDVVYRLEIAEDTEGFRARAVVEAPPREVTRRSISREEFVRIPGTRGDALRAVELLPGVARPPFLAGSLIVRGAAPGDSEVFFDGVSVPLLYHFGGLTSFTNSRMLERIDFYPGNFSVRYGRRMGGILEVTPRDPDREKLHAVLDVNLIDASFLIEGPITDEISVAVAARRSYVDFIFDTVVPADAFDVIAAPVYYDYQVFATYRPTSNDRFHFGLYGSSDQFRVVFSDASDADPTIRGNLDLATSFHRVSGGWYHRFDSQVEQELTLAAGPTNLTFAFGDSLKFDATFTQITVRDEWRFRLNPAVRLIAGIDMQIAPADLVFRGPAPAQTEGSPQMDPLAQQEIIDYAIGLTTYRPAMYIESELTPIDPLRIVLGVRLDWFRDIQRWSFDPRIVSIYSLSDRTRLKMGIGMFSQPPEFQESAPDLGNPNLRVIRALHTSAGFEHEVDDAISFGAEGFFKYLTRRVVGTERGEAPLFENAGIGRIFGLEISGRYKPRGRFFGFLSYTLMRSERRDRGNAQWRLFDFDQTHILTLSGTYRLGAGWELGGTFRLVSGNPYTPIVGGVYNADVDLYQALYGPTNSARNPFFHRLDVRIQKTWQWDDFSLALYLDVQNVYNQTNREGVFYNFDFSQSSDLPGLPFLPSLGLRGELP